MSSNLPNTPNKSRHFATGWRGTLGKVCIILGIVCAVCILLLLPQVNDSAPTDDSEDHFSESSASASEYIQISARELLNAYNANEVNADNLYGGKLLLVTGTVKNIGKDILDNVYITVSDGAEYELISVQCYFSDAKEIDKVAALSEGQTVNVLGTCDGAIANVVMEGCILC